MEANEDTVQPACHVTRTHEMCGKVEAAFYLHHLAGLPRILVPHVWNRVYFYAFLVFLRGIGETAAGSIAYANLTSGR